MPGGRPWIVLLFALPACAPTPDPAPDVVPAVTITTRAVPDSNFVGAWQSGSAADSLGAILRLELRGSGAATLAHDNRDDSPAVLEAGGWSALGDGRVEVRFDARNGQRTPASKRTFWLDGDTLRSVAGDASLWGSGGAKFVAVPADSMTR